MLPFYTIGVVFFLYSLYQAKNILVDSYPNNGFAL